PRRPDIFGRLTSIHADFHPRAKFPLGFLSMDENDEMWTKISAKKHNEINSLYLYIIIKSTIHVIYTYSICSYLVLYLCNIQGQKGRNANGAKQHHAEGRYHRGHHPQ